MNRYIILTSACVVALCAAIFSVTGIAQLFVGAPYTSGFMAASLELGKIVSISFLYRYWHDIPKFLRGYLIVGGLILMLITSVGIYGYLSSAYASGAMGIQNKENQIALSQNQQQMIDANISTLSNRLGQLQTIQRQQENRLDSLVARGRALNTQQSMIRETNKEIGNVRQEISTLMNQRDSLQLQSLNTKSELTSTGKIGTFYYIAQTFNLPLDTIVKWFIFVIVLVFDPLSITLFLAYNIVDRKRSTKTDIVVQEITHDTLQPQSPTPNVVETDQSNIQESESLPYYMKSNFDWSQTDTWTNDPAARAYYQNLGVRPIDKST